MAVATITRQTSLAFESYCRLAIVMPVYNEGSTISDTLGEIGRKLMPFLPNARIMIFEDGSRDDTKEVLASVSQDYPWLDYQTSWERKGYPKAVKDAIGSVDESKFDFILFLDSDGQYDPSDTFNLLRTMNEDQVDIVMARRLNRPEPVYRRTLSKGLRILEKLLFNPTCRDMTSAFRLMKTHAAKSLSARTTYSKYNFWLEFTARAAEEGYTMVEVPVTYRERPGQISKESNVYSLNKMPKIVWREFVAILRTWWDYRRPHSGTKLLIAEK